MKTHFNVITIFILERSDFTANPGTRLVDFDFISLIQQFYSGGKTGKTGTDNGNFELGVAGFRDGSVGKKGAKRDIFQRYIVDVSDVRGGRCLNSLSTDDNTCVNIKKISNKR